MYSQQPIGFATSTFRPRQCCACPSAHDLNFATCMVAGLSQKKILKTQNPTPEIEFVRVPGH
jgi:hypothetical protein